MVQQYCGCVSNPEAIEAFLAKENGGKLLLSTAPHIQDSGKGKEAFLFEIERQLTGKVRPPHAQEIGDCVSHGTTGAAEDLQFVQMNRNKALTFKWLSSEVMYALARHQVGRDACGRGDGAVVAWALEAGKTFGMVARDKYGNIDISNYNSHYAKSWGAPGAGCPSDLLPIAKTHLFTEAHLVTGQNKYEQCRDALMSGGVIVTGSNQLYSSQRDSQGFCRPEGSGGHCTYYRGFADGPKRPGIVYQQSWGQDIPTGGEMRVTLESGREVILPPGAFFIDAENFDRMHRGSDSEVWVLTAEDGFLAPDEEVKFAFY